MSSLDRIICALGGQSGRSDVLAHVYLLHLGTLQPFPSTSLHLVGLCESTSTMYVVSTRACLPATVYLTARQCRVRVTACRLPCSHTMSLLRHFLPSQTTDRSKQQGLSGINYHRVSIVLYCIRVNDQMMLYCRHPLNVVKTPADVLTCVMYLDIPINGSLPYVLFTFHEPARTIDVPANGSQYLGRTGCSCQRYPMQPPFLILSTDTRLPYYHSQYLSSSPLSRHLTTSLPQHLIPHIPLIIFFPSCYRRLSYI